MGVRRQLRTDDRSGKSCDKTSTGWPLLPTETTMIFFILWSCAQAPSGCSWVPPAEVGTILPSGEPAYCCDGYYDCGDHAEYDGEVYQIDHVYHVDTDDPEEEEVDRLWCDRCRWCDEPALFGEECL